MSIGERPASAKTVNTDQVSAVMQELAEVQGATAVNVDHSACTATEPEPCLLAQVKKQIEGERAALTDQQHRFVAERTKLAGRLAEAVATCPEPTEQLSPGVIGEWSELHSLANQLAVGTTEVRSYCTQANFVYRAAIGLTNLAGSSCR